MCWSALSGASDGWYGGAASPVGCCAWIWVTKLVRVVNCTFCTVNTLVAVVYCTVSTVTIRFEVAAETVK